MLDYTSIEVLLRERTAERDRATLPATRDHPGQEQATPSGTEGYDQQPVEPPFLWVDAPAGDGESLREPISDAASAAADGAGALAEGAGEAATGFLEAAAHVAGEVLQVLGAILSALGDADWD